MFRATSQGIVSSNMKARINTMKCDVIEHAEAADASSPERHFGVIDNRMQT